MKAIALLLLFPFSVLAATNISVTTFGAVGDAIKVYVNVVADSTTIDFTNTLTGADIGKTVQITGCGAISSAPNCQDLIATITNVSGGNAVIDFIPKRTLTATFCWYGTDNRAAFTNAIAQTTAGSNYVSIPTGWYLFKVSPYADIQVSIPLFKGGLNFVGAGTNETRLIGNGAWTLSAGSVTRGRLFACITPITNDLPVRFVDMTIDGGVENGNTTNHGFPANTTTGDGWDITHDAIEIYGGTGNAWTQWAVSNLLVAHWRGEQLKQTSASTNSNFLSVNCRYFDGQATALNNYGSWAVTNNWFEKLYESFEYYQRWCTNSSLFANNTITNMTGAGLAINGAIIGEAEYPFLIRSNLFYVRNQQNCIQTTPARSVSIMGNVFNSPDSTGVAIALGTAGYQGSAPNSNIVVGFNVFTSVFYGISVQGAGQNSTYNLTIASNTASSINTFASGYGWGTNMVLRYNTSDGTGVGGSDMGQWYLDEASNNFLRHDNFDYAGITNPVSYASGYRQKITVAQAGSRWKLDNATPLQIPSGAQINLANLSGGSVNVYLNSAMTGNAVAMADATTNIFRWSGSSWTTNQAGIQGNLTIGGNLIISQ